MNRICISFVKRKKVSKYCICVFCSSVKLNEISKFWALNCTKMRLAAGLRPDPLGSYSTPPDPLAVIRGGEGREGEEGQGKGRGKGEGKGHSNPPLQKVWLRACRRSVRPVEISHPQVIPKGSSTGDLQDSGLTLSDLRKIGLLNRNRKY